MIAIAPQHREGIASALSAVQGRARKRTLDLRTVLDTVEAALLTGADTREEGGTVGKSYGYAAETTDCTVRWADEGLGVTIERNRLSKFDPERRYATVTTRTYRIPVADLTAEQVGIRMHYLVAEEFAATLSALQSERYRTARIEAGRTTSPARSHAPALIANAEWNERKARDLKSRRVHAIYDLLASLAYLGAQEGRSITVWPFAQALVEDGRTVEDLCANPTRCVVEHYPNPGEVFDAAAAAGGT